MSAIRWTLRDAGPSQIERARANTARLRVYRDQVPVALAGTYTLTDDAGNVIINAQTVSADGTDITYAIAAGDTTTSMAFSTRWRETWVLTIAAIPLQTVTFTRDAWLIRSALYPVVTVDDIITGRHRDLVDLVDGGASAIEGYVNEAWATINADLIKRGKRPSLIMESWALRSLHLYRALHLCFLDASTRYAGEDRFSKLADHYAELAETEWNKNLRFDYDANEDGIADTQTAGANVLVLTAGNMSGPRWSMAR